METILAMIGGALLLLYVSVLRWARASRAKWEAEHLTQCPGCGRLIHPR